MNATALQVLAKAVWDELPARSGLYQDDVAKALELAGVDKLQTHANRQQRKLDKRDRKIAALEARIKELERANATQALNAKRLPIDVERAVQQALCNVRMIPVIGTSSSKIMSITLTEHPKT